MDGVGNLKHLGFKMEWDWNLGFLGGIDTPDSCEQNLQMEAKV